MIKNKKIKAIVLGEFFESKSEVFDFMFVIIALYYVGYNNQFDAAGISIPFPQTDVHISADWKKLNILKGNGRK